MMPVRFLSLLVLCCLVCGQEVYSDMSASYTQWGDTCYHGSFSASRTYTVNYSVREAFWIPPGNLYTDSDWKWGVCFWVLPM